MDSRKTTKPNTALWRTRRRLNLELKQVAWALGHKTADQIARYERGEAEPNLDNAIRLSIIYGCGADELFPVKYEAFRRQLLSRILTITARGPDSGAELLSRIYVCSYEEALDDPVCSEQYATHVRDHITNLAKRLAGL